MSKSDEERFERWANSQSAKGKDIRVTLMKQGDLAQFRKEYGVTSHIHKRYCPFCGYKQLYESLGLGLDAELADRGMTLAVCRECKAESVFSILKEGVLPEDKFVVHSEGDTSPEEDS